MKNKQEDRAMHGDHRTYINIEVKPDPSGIIHVSVFREGELKFTLYGLAYATMLLLKEKSIPFQDYLKVLQLALNDVKKGYISYTIDKKEAEKQTGK